MRPLQVDPVSSGVGPETEPFWNETRFRCYMCIHYQYVKRRSSFKTSADTREDTTPQALTNPLELQCGIRI
ncbi:hypothetical protein K1719_012401 [Acacia pycnantha]|nr:hypothetical protein K1719_012401 [Acacia pycnantha]